MKADEVEQQRQQATIVVIARNLTFFAIEDCIVSQNINQNQYLLLCVQLNQFSKNFSLTLRDTFKRAILKPNSAPTPDIFV